MESSHILLLGDKVIDVLTILYFHKTKMPFIADTALNNI